MDREDFLRRIDELAVWKRGDQRAPHKPLLLLLALGRLVAKGQTEMPFLEGEDELRRLLQEFGPQRQSYHPEFPFWHLQSDGLWVVPDADGIAFRTGGHSPSATELRRKKAVGGFPAPLIHLLGKDPDLIVEAARRILDAHFPESMHQDLLEEVGLDLAPRLEPALRRPRDPAFRVKILQAYEFRCGICGLDVRLGGRTISLEAAHIQWHQAHGPDVESNGISLCPLHHKIFDRGGLTIAHDQRVLVSASLSGNEVLDTFLLRFHGEKIRAPHHPAHHPASEFLEWHRREVFHGEPRYLAS